MSGSEIILEGKHLGRCYIKKDKKVQALKDVSFELHEGEILGIVGESGSGKSTMLNILGCLDKPTSGEYYIDEIEVSKFSSDKLSEIRNKKIGFVFQSYNLLPRTAAIEQVLTIRPPFSLR